MRTLAAFASATCLACASSSGADAPPRLSDPVAFFSTGDQLPGTITRIEAPDQAIFESPALTDPNTINLSKLLEIRAETLPRSSAADHEAVLTLTNGDSLRGQLAGLDEKSVTLDTSYAGRLAIRRSMADGLVVNDQPRTLFHGPVSIEDWNISGDNKPWRFENGAFVSQAPGSIARDIKLPEKFALSFELAWRSSLRFRLSVCSDDATSDNPGNAYNLVCQRRYVYLGKRWSEAGENGSTFLGNTANVGEFNEKERARIELRVDRKNGLFVLLIDDRRAATWNDADPHSENMGGALHFVAEDTSPLQVSRIRVMPWDGKDDELGTEDPGKTEATDSKPADGSQRIALRNGDHVTGVVTGVEDSVIKIKSTHGDIRLPVSRMRSVVLHTEADKKDLDRYEKPKLMTGDVRAWFPEGGHVVFRLDSIENGILKGYSQTFGEASFRIDAFQRIEFNIHDWDLEPLRPKGIW